MIIFCHFPIFPEDRHNLLNDAELLEIVGKYDCVKLWFSGHHHHGNYGVHHDIHFVNVRGMVESEFDVPFSMVRLFEDHVLVDGYGPEISAKLVI